MDKVQKIKKGFLFMCFVLAFNVIVKADVISKSEKKALIALYNSTNGENWLHKWNLNEPVSKWYGVKIANNHVVEINLFRNNLRG